MTLQDAQDILARLKGEGASADDPRVKEAISEFARLLTAERLARRIESAMSLQDRVLGR